MINKKVSLVAAGIILPMLALAQGASDAYSFVRPDMRGTARYMSMGGAFSALGADMSAITYNPGGIGVYRGSEIGATLDLSIFQSDAKTPLGPNSRNNVIPYLNNIGYVGTFNLHNSVLRNINWGITYNRVASYSRRSRGFGIPTANSMSNYIAGVANIEGVTEGDVTSEPGIDPYNPPYGYYMAPWITTLGYASKLIYPENKSADETEWSGLWGTGTSGVAYMETTESGGVDQYNLTFGGNIADVFFWGMDFAITDMQYKKTSLYGEQLDNAFVYGDRPAEIADWDLYNYYKVNGTGFNYKLGFIVKPIQELRIGFAFHTPTYYSMEEYFYANTTYYNTALHPDHGSAETNDGFNGYNEYNFHTPWKINVGIAGVLFNRMILSADYNWEGTSRMKFKDTWSDYGDAYALTNQDIRNTYKDIHTLRVGAEYRVTPQLSVRAGYSYVSSPVKTSIMDGSEDMYTAGTRPEYTLDHSTNYVTAGLGYKFKKFYIDAAYVYKHENSTWHGFTSTESNRGQLLPKADISFDTHQVIISAGYRF